MQKNAEKTVTVNRKARHDYFILETYEAGISLKGTEVKSLREGRANLRESFARVKDGEIYLFNAHISPYSHGNQLNHDPTRPRKLLLHKREIRRLEGKTTEKGLTLVPLKLYFRGGKAKVELALAQGKRHYDRREDLKRKAIERDMERELRSREAR